MTGAAEGSVAAFHYLDWAATAPLCPQAEQAMRPFMQPGVEGLLLGNANANALHPAGRTAFKLLEQARKSVAVSLGARPDEVVFTSGATESCVMALTGLTDAAMLEEERRGHIDCVPRVVVSSIEHEAVLEAAHQLGTWGAEVVLVAPDSTGHVVPEALREACADGALLVSVQAVNNEMGAVQDIEALARVAHDAGALFHTDATQALGRVELDAHAWGVDALSVSGHKAGGPKGIGALYLKARTPFSAQAVGGGQESGRRGGTQNVSGAVGMAAAFAHAVEEREGQGKRLVELRDLAYGRLCALPGVQPVVEVAPGSAAFAPHIVAVTVQGVESETSVMQLGARGVAVSGGSACSSGSLDPSHVMRALGLPRDRALTLVRASFGELTEEADVDALVAALSELL